MRRWNPLKSLLFITFHETWAGEWVQTIGFFMKFMRLSMRNLTKALGMSRFGDGTWAQTIGFTMENMRFWYEKSSESIDLQYKILYFFYTLAYPYDKFLISTIKKYFFLRDAAESPCRITAKRNKHGASPSRMNEDYQEKFLGGSQESGGQ